MKKSETMLLRVSAVGYGRSIPFLQRHALLVYASLLMLKTGFGGPNEAGINFPEKEKKKRSCQLLETFVLA